MENLQLLASGYGLIEGPVYDPARGLIFTDVTKGGAYCVAADGKVSVVVPHRKGMGGLAIHASGGMIVSGRTIAYKPPGEGATVNLIPENAASGIVGFNDLVTDDTGRIYAGSLAGNPFGDDKPKSAFLHLIELDGSHRVVATDVHLTNGLGFSLNGRLLYHSDSGLNAIKIYDVEKNGDLGAPRIFAETGDGSPDGLAVASDGAIWIALAYGGAVVCYNPGGREIARIVVPDRLVTSLCFGGADWRDLYIVTGPDRAVPDGTGRIYRIRMDIPGLPRPLARVRIMS